MVTLAALARPLPGCGPVDMVHIENSAVAVDTSLPVCSNRGVGWGVGGIRQGYQLRFYSTVENAFVNHDSVSWKSVVE